MFGRLLLLFLVVPIVDLALLVRVGDRIGFWPTVATVVVTAVVGSWLARREGAAAWSRVQRTLAGGGVPGKELLDGVIILVAGALLLTPGFLTDLVGLLGLLPPSRALLRRALRTRFEAAVQSGGVRMSMGGPGGFGRAGFGAVPGGHAPFAGARPEPPAAEAPRPAGRDDGAIEDAVVIEEEEGPAGGRPPRASP